MKIIFSLSPHWHSCFHRGFDAMYCCGGVVSGYKTDNFNHVVTVILLIIEHKLHLKDDPNLPYVRIKKLCGLRKLESQPFYIYIYLYTL